MDCILTLSGDSAVVCLKKHSNVFIPDISDKGINRLIRSSYGLNMSICLFIL